MKKKQIKLDADEKEILESYERGEWIPVKNQKHEKDLAKKTAKNTLRKDV